EFAVATFRQVRLDFRRYFPRHIDLRFHPSLTRLSHGCSLDAGMDAGLGCRAAAPSFQRFPDQPDGAEPLAEIVNRAGDHELVGAVFAHDSPMRLAHLRGISD